MDVMIVQNRLFQTLLIDIVNSCCPWPVPGVQTEIGAVLFIICQIIKYTLLDIRIAEINNILGFFDKQIIQ